MTHEVRDFVWTHGWGKMFKDLQDAPYLASQANRLAEEVRQAKLAEPDRPIYLVGRSGGAGLVLLAAAQLPPATLERIILLSAAVSPTCDLRPALRATRHELVSFYSSFDWFVLGWGTTKFGTADRVHGPSAGLAGFVRPDDLDAEGQELYKRLFQIRWVPSMLTEGFDGGHVFGTSTPAFVTKELAPWLR